MTAIVHKVKYGMAGKELTHEATWNDIRLADMGNVGAAFVALSPMPPHNDGWIKKGNSERIDKKYVLKARDNALFLRGCLIMKKLMTTMLAASLYAASAHADDYAQHAAESRATAMKFMRALKGELQQGMQAGGPVNAIDVCKLHAPGIAESMSVKKGWDIGRTSLKVRNPDNVPDTWELSVLEEFEERKRAGEDPKELEHYEAVEKNDKQVFRYMKAIVTAELCVACHGADIAPIVVTKLDDLYPRDEARGFKVGDIRGAFTIARPLPSAGN